MDRHLDLRSRGRLAWLLAMGTAALAVLVACGGGTPSDAPAGPPVLQGRASTGYRILSEFSVRALAGTPRSLSQSTQGDGSYRLPLDDLQAPYVLRASSPVSGEAFHALATRPGALNVTPLTELVAAALLGEPAGGFYDGLRWGVSDVAPITAQALTQAEARVRTLLVQRLGIDVPESLLPFGEVDFSVAADDPMTQVLRVLRQRVADQGRLFADLVDDVAEDSARCRGESLALLLGDAPDRFCPLSRSRVSVPGSVQTLGFANVFGDRLQLRLQGEQVLDVRLDRSGAGSGACSGAACAGLRVGPADSQGRRSLDFVAVMLGSTRLDGQLHSGQGEDPRPCTGIPMRLLGPDGTTELRCVARRIATSKFGRVSHAFQAKTDAGWLLNVITEGDRVVWVSVGDPLRAGLSGGGQRWRCQGAGCAGATASALAADGTRHLSLKDVRLALVGADGQADEAVQARLSTELDTIALNEPPLPVCTPFKGLVLANSDGTRLELCADRLALNPSWEDLDGDGQPDQFWGSLGDVGRYTMTINVLAWSPTSGLADGVELLTRYINSDGAESLQTVHYRCGGGCAGVTARQDGDLTRLHFQDVLLLEMNPDGQPGDRTLSINGDMP
ncbi:hypothetical protein KAK06_04760 [Ideonella sp. 4Y11]|uniref:Lipoprotein n=1 Tax=Ideonella aquatica TaxID=2824119 RepID=A0A941BK74_9BURK|nr:hypothetical protein [Ideonella aquatica]MBQ0958259.1 hypothetical protein [Ideonella aquatica]